MKNLIKIFLTLFVISMSMAMYAQKLDRTKAPGAGLAPKINIGSYKSFVLPNGLNVIVVENNKLPKVSMSLILDIQPDLEKEAVGSNSMAGSLLRKGTANRTKEQIDDQIDFIGASLNTFSTGASGSCLKKHLQTYLELFADVVLNPIFPEAELEKMKKQQISSLASMKDDPNSINDMVSSVLRNGKNHPYGELVTEETTGKITLDKCKKYYSTYFRPNVAYLVFVGDITEAEAKTAAEKYFSKWQKAVVPKFDFKTPVLPSGNVLAFVDKPGAVQSVVAVTYAVDLKPGSADAIKASVMNGILGGGVFSGRLMMNLREDKGYTYGARSSLSEDELVGNFEASAQVKGEVTDSSIIQFLYEMKRLTTELVPKDQVELTKNVMNGSFARGLENPQTIARFAVNTALNKLPKDYYQNYLENLSKVTPADVMAMAKKYIKPDNSYIVVVGNKEKEAKKLNNFSAKKTVEFFDIYGNPFVETKLKTTPDNVTAQTIVDNYLKVTGGKDKYLKITDITTKMSMSMQGMNISIEKYQKAPNKSATLTLMGGNLMQKQVFDGTKGFAVAGGQTKEVGGKDLDKLKEEAVMHSECKYAELGYKLTLAGIEAINGKDAYKIELVSPTEKKSTDYYDVESGLKVKTVMLVEMGGNAVTVTVDFADYREVDGIKFPFSITQIFGGREMKIVVSSVDFKTVIEDKIFSAN